METQPDDVCFWCHLDIQDGVEESGGESPSWENDGDFGCDKHPISGEDGTGPHETEAEVRAIVKAYHEKGTR